MKITNINTSFPVINIGDEVMIKMNGAKRRKCVKIVATWYPKHNDEWNEKEEGKRMGYCGSNPNHQFPQLLAIDKQNRRIRIYGNDTLEEK